MPSHSTVTSHGLQWRTKALGGHLVAILASLQLIGCFSPDEGWGLRGQTRETDGGGDSGADTHLLQLFSSGSLGRLVHGVLAVDDLARLLARRFTHVARFLHFLFLLQVFSQ